MRKELHDTWCHPRICCRQSLGRQWPLTITEGHRAQPTGTVKWEKSCTALVPNVALGYAVGKAWADNDPDLVSKVQRCVESGSWHQQHSQSANMQNRFVKRGNKNPCFVQWIWIRSDPKLLAGSGPGYGSAENHSGSGQFRIRNEFAS
jgi:hypothetical protein